MSQTTAVGVGPAQYDTTMHLMRYEAIDLLFTSEAAILDAKTRMVDKDNIHYGDEYDF